MKPTSSETMSSVPVTSSHHADKNTQKNKSRNWQKGRVVPSKGILVNQGLKKIKLEEDFIPIKVEANVTTEATSEDRDGDDMFTEEFTVKREEVNSSVVPPEQPGQEGQSSSSYSCREEVEALKKAVKQLTLQVKKHNEVITKIMSSLRNAALSVMNCCQNDEDEDEANRDGDRGGESEVNDVTSEPSSRSVSEDPLLIQNDVSQECIDINQEQEIPQNSLEGSVSKLSVAKCSDVPSVFSNKSFASLGTLTSEAGPHYLGQNTEHAKMDDDMQSESSLRNGVLSVMTCSQDDDEVNEASRDGIGGGESAVSDESSEPTSRSVREDPLLTQNDVSQECIDINQEQEISQNSLEGMDSNISVAKCSGVPSVFSNKSFASLDTCSSESCSRDLGQNMESAEMDDGQDFEFEEDKDSDVEADKHSERGSDMDKGKKSPYKCHLCSKVFKSPNGIYLHIRSAHKGVRYNCTKCPGKFTQFCLLQRHEKLVHKDGGPPTQKCEICGVHLLKSKLCLRNHMTKIHKKSESESAHRQNGVLSVERLRKVGKGEPDTHSEKGNNMDKEKESPHKCHLCTKRFKYSSGIYHHIKSVHEGVRYNCTKCPGKFTHFPGLQRHENKVHKADHNLQLIHVNKQLSRQIKF